MTSTNNYIERIRDQVKETSGKDRDKRLKNLAKAKRNDHASSLYHKTLMIRRKCKSDISEWWLCSEIVQKRMI